jgi:tRNA(fMet)-specific endonuclease VapC
MSHLAMLDTNIVSELARSPRGKLLEQIAIIGEDRICISAITAAELRYGVRKKGSVKLERDMGDVLATLDILPFEPPADAFYGQIRHALTSAGTPIGPVDFFIAAHALSLGLTLVTANVGEFSRVPGLKVENWLD